MLQQAFNRGFIKAAMGYQGSVPVQLQMLLQQMHSQALAHPSPVGGITSHTNQTGNPQVPNQYMPLLVDRLAHPGMTANPLKV